MPIADYFMLAGWVGPWQIAIIVIVLLLIFGRKLPDLARALGKSLVEFKKGIKAAKKEIDDAGEGEEPTDKQQKNTPDGTGDDKS